MKKPIPQFKAIDFSRYYPLFFTIIFVVILFQYSFSTLESIFYDLRVRFDGGIEYNENIVLVTMDEESDEFLGEKFPYTYATHNRLFEKLLKDKPKIVNYFINLLESEGEIDLLSQMNFQKSLEQFKQGGGAFHFGTDMDSWGEQLPPQALRTFGHKLALINLDNAQFAKDDVVRRAILNISGENSLHLWTANRYRSMLGKETLDVSKIKGSYYVREADANFTLFRYYTSPLEENKRIIKIPFHRVVVGNFPKGFFTNKIVLVGSTYISNSSDYVLTPFNKEEYKASKLFVHAEIIQSLIQNKTIYKIPMLVTYVLSLLIAILLSVTILKLRPTHGLIITIIVMLSLFLIGYLLFSVFGLWLYLTHLILTVPVVYYIWVPFRAIGEYQRRYAIQEESKLLKKVENLKQNFISLMSHDLKTPVSRIAGIADITLKQHGDRPELKKNLISILEATRELNRFINSILDLTKIESRNIKLNIVSKDINPIIESIIESLKYEAVEKDIQIGVNLSPLYPISVDVDLIKRVISNLIENALKYSGKNSKIEVITWDDATWVFVEITDNGIGIPEEDLGQIFDKFYRVKNDASHSIKGSGLGLYLVKYFVELHGGTIVATSQVNVGTKFQIKLKNA